MAISQHHTQPGDTETAHGTVAFGYENATSPEQRSDIPPMRRVGMPLYDPALYDAPADDDPNIVDGDVVEDKNALSSGDKGKSTGTVVKK